jgi:enoyl-CoA hydratase/carnithine racemase
MKNYEMIHVEQNEEVLTVSLNRPRLNLFNSRMMEELIQVWHSLRRESSIRFVILTARGDHFSAGVDLGEIEIKDFKPEDARLQQLAGHELMRSLESVEQVTIAAMRGAVIGAGMAVAQACDFRIMSENSYYSVPETMIGTYYTWGCTPRLVRLVGATKAMEIIMTCDPVPAQEAYRLNLANKVVPDAALMEATREFVARIAAKSPTCIRITKKIALGASMEGFGNMLAIEPELMQGVVHTGETQEGITAFLQKREPNFKKGE